MQISCIAASALPMCLAERRPWRWSVRPATLDAIALQHVGVQTSGLRIGYFATILEDPRLVWSRSDASDAHHAVGETDHLIGRTDLKSQLRRDQSQRFNSTMNIFSGRLVSFRISCGIKPGSQ